MTRGHGLGNRQIVLAGSRPRWVATSRMANTRKLTRADIYKQIDAFRGIVKRDPDGKLSAEQWAETKRVELENGKSQRPAAPALPPSRPAHTPKAGFGDGG